MVDKTLDEMKRELQDLIGKKRFIQFAFYLSPAKHTGLDTPWVKVETEVKGRYYAWQSRTKKTLALNFENCIKMIKVDLKKTKKKKKI